MQTSEPVSNPNQQTSDLQPVNTSPVSEASIPQEPIANKQSLNWLITGFIILLLGTIGIFAFQNYQLKQKVLQKQPILLPEPTETFGIPSPIPTVDPTVNWEIYENKNYGFFLKYPSNFKAHNLTYEKPFDALEDPITFGIVLTQNIYVNLAQTPVIKVQLVQTDKTINQILDQLRVGIENSKEGMADPEHMYYKANPPKINSIEVVQAGSIEVTKVERYQGPGGPNAEILEYYIKSPNYVFILTANYGTNNPDVGQDGTLEKEVLSKIISTFQFTN